MSFPSERLTAVLARFESALLRFARSRCGDGEMARDAVQETMMRFIRNAPKGEVEEMGPLLFTTCRHVVIDLHRKASRIVPMDPSAAPELVNAESAEPGPAEQMEGRETATLLRRMIAALPEAQREVVRLKFQHGMAYRDISAATGLTVSNVGWLLHQAVQEMRREWARREADPAIR